MDSSFQRTLINFLRYLFPISTLLSPDVSCIFLCKGHGKLLSQGLCISHPVDFTAVYTRQWGA